MRHASCWRYSFERGTGGAALCCGPAACQNILQWAMLSTQNDIRGTLLTSLVTVLATVVRMAVYATRESLITCLLCVVRVVSHILYDALLPHHDDPLSAPSRPLPPFPQCPEMPQPIMMIPHPHPLTHSLASSSQPLPWRPLWLLPPLPSWLQHWQRPALHSCRMQLTDWASTQDWQRETEGQPSRPLHFHLPHLHCWSASQYSCHHPGQKWSCLMDGLSCCSSQQQQ